MPAMENLTSIENLSVNLRDFRVFPLNNSDLALAFGPDGSHGGQSPLNLTFLSVLQLQDLVPHQLEVEGGAESRLERTGVEQSTLDDAMLVALHAITAWGPKALARSTLTAVGSVLVSLLVGLVLWLGILQYLGLPRPINRRKSFLDQREMLNAIAEKVVRDLAEYRDQVDDRDDFHDLLESPSDDRRHLIPFPVDVAVSPIVKPDLGFGRSDLHQHTLKIPLVDNVGLAKIDGNHLDQFRRISRKQSSLKPFRPSPVDDVILPMTTVQPSYRPMTKRPNTRKRPNRRIGLQQLRRPGFRRLGKPKILQTDTRRTQRNRLHRLKPSDSQEKNFPRAPLDTPMSPRRRNERKPQVLKPNKVRENLLPYRQEDPHGGAGDRAGERGFQLPSRYWNSLKGRSVKKELSREDYSEMSNEEDDKNPAWDVSTDTPISVTTFRTNRKHNFMDRLGSDPYEIDQYFPNHYQPVNLYHDHTDIESLHHQAGSVEPRIREEMIQRIRNLYDTFIGNDGSQTPISEYLDPTSYVANRNFFEADFKKNLQELSHHLPPNTSVHRAIESFNHRYATLESGEEDHRRKNESQWHEEQVASSVEHIVNTNLLNQHQHSSNEEGTKLLNRHQHSSSEEGINLQNQHQHSSKEQVQRSAEDGSDLPPSSPAYNATSKQKVFEKVKGISDELLMALFPDYMKKQSKLNKRRNHRYDGYTD